MTSAALPTVPPALVRAIAEGRCVAFIGAGMSRPDAPDWLGLLRDLATRLSKRAPAADDALALLEGSPQAADLEAAAQILRDASGKNETDFEEAVEQILGQVAPSKTARRYELLAGIPFESILTTNLDNLIRGDSPDATTYARLLRGDARATRRWQFSARHAPHVIKLHGDANGSAEKNPVVLARSDYRRRLYQDGRYSNFLRAVFATRTLLFLGVSFTDAYLNELRSEVLALVRAHHDDRDEPIGYAVMADRPQAWCEFMRRHDGIEILRYDAAGDEEHQGFTRWLEAIHAATAPGPRVASLLREAAKESGTAPRIVWVDRHPDNNRRAEVESLRAGGVLIDEITSPDRLEESAHGSASLLITSFDRGARPPVFDQVMDRVHPWRTRPPVVVFTFEDEIQWKRRHALRRGAAECCCDWGTLFDTIERLFAVRRAI